MCISSGFWLEIIMKAARESNGWYWLRFEWQNRGAIYCHGLARLGNAPDTYQLSRDIIEGHLASFSTQAFMDPLNLSQETISKIELVIRTIIIWLVSCINYHFVEGKKSRKGAHKFL